MGAWVGPSQPLFSFAQSFYHLWLTETCERNISRHWRVRMGETWVIWLRYLPDSNGGAILQALSVDVDREITQERRFTSAVIESLAAKFEGRRRAKDAELRKVNHLAVNLRRRTRSELETALNELKGPLSQLAEPQINMTEGGPDRNNAHWYKYEVVRSGNEAGKFVNFEEDHYFIKASIRVGRERLIFVTSFHHIGRELSGLMEATAFAQLISYEQSEDRDRISQDFFLCSLEPFVFTYRTEEGGIETAYDNWLDTALAVSIKEYGDRL